MYRRLIVLIVALAACLTAANDCMAQYDSLKFGDFGISSVTPNGLSSVNGSVWVDVQNPQVGFAVTRIHGRLYKDGVPLIEGHADDYYVPHGTSKITLTGVASLCPGASIFDVLGLIFFEAEKYSVDIKAVITDDGAPSQIKEVKNMPVLTLLKKDGNE